MNVQDKIEIYTSLNPRFLLKGHKPDFNNKPSIRSVASCVSDFGSISKKYLTHFDVMMGSPDSASITDLVVDV